MLTEQQTEALRELRRTYLVNMEYQEQLDEGAWEAIEDVLTAFGLSLICHHDWVRIAVDGTRACPYCGAVVLKDVDAAAEQA